MLIDAYEKNILRIILDEYNEIMVFAPLFTSIRIDRDELHRGMINKYTYECDPHILTLFFRGRSFKEMNNLILINQIFWKSKKIDLESLESTYNYCKLVAEFAGVLNDTIRIEVDGEFRDEPVPPPKSRKNKLFSTVSNMYFYIKSRFVRY